MLRIILLISFLSFTLGYCSSSSSENYCGSDSYGTRYCCDGGSYQCCSEGDGYSCNCGGLSSGIWSAIVVSGCITLAIIAFCMYNQQRRRRIAMQAGTTPILGVTIVQQTYIQQPAPYYPPQPQYGRPVQCGY